MASDVDKTNSPLARKVLESIRPYTPGKPIQEVERELGLSGVVKLASNENPLGPSPKAMEACRSAMAEAHLYPDARGFYLKEAIAEKYGIREEEIALGAGADELIKMIGLAFLNPGEEVVTGHPSFVQYRFVSNLMGADFLAIPLRDYTFDADAIIDAITPKTKLIFICNPNNPTGTIIGQEPCERIVRAAQKSDCLVVFDEAYREFVESSDYPDAMGYVRDGLPVIVLRTFSKIYGLAGLRVGWAYSRPDIISCLNKVRIPFNVSSIAQEAARAALQDDEHVARSRNITQIGKRYLYSEFERLNLFYIPTEANFIAVKFGDKAPEIYEHILKNGVVTRLLDSFGMPGFIRITIGTPEQNERLVRAIVSYLSGRQVSGGRNGLVIAIDGPAGSGKSTIASMLANRLGLRYVSTGLMYRALTLKVIRSGASAYDDAEVGNIAQNLDLRFEWSDPATMKVFMDGEDVTGELTSPEVDSLVSPVSRVPLARKILTERQRLLARDGGVVMEGRDIGTVVLPEADLKIFLTASPAERAVRRSRQLSEKGISQDISKIRENIEMRDKMDSERVNAPLKPADDSITLDTTGKSPERVISEILDIVGSLPGKCTG